MTEVTTELKIDLSQYNIDELVQSAINYHVARKADEMAQNMVKNVTEQFLSDNKLKWSVELAEADKKIQDAISQKINSLVEEKIKNSEWSLRQSLNRAIEQVTHNQIDRFVDDCKDRIVFLEKDEKVVREEQ